MSVVSASRGRQEYANPDERHDGGQYFWNVHNVSPLSHALSLLVLGSVAILCPSSRRQRQAPTTST
jgi:hypothetical protein